MAARILECTASERACPPTEHEVLAVAGSVLLPATLTVPPHPKGIVLITTSLEGGSHRDTTSRAFTSALCNAELAILSVGVLSRDEARDDVRSDSIRNDAPIVSRRIEGVTDWLTFHPLVQHLPVGYLGTGAAASEALLIAAAARASVVQALVLFDGRPDIVAGTLARVKAPVLASIDDEERPPADELTAALAQAAGPVEFVQISGDVGNTAGLSSTGAVLARLADLAEKWLLRYLPSYVSQ